jgi:hypothetical protein
MTEKKTEAPNNLWLWNNVQSTDPKFVKDFNRGGFKGTATNPTWLAKRATEAFGPIGTGWGVDIEQEDYMTGAPLLGPDGSVLAHEIIHVLRARIWYVLGAGENRERSSFLSFGQTTFVGKNKNGLFTDEEAPKKSLTDATTKGLAQLGFAADIHMGMWDDSKYVNDRKREFDQKKAEENKPDPAAIKALGVAAAAIEEAIKECNDDASVRALWKEWSGELDKIKAGAPESFTSLKENFKKRADEVKGAE